MGLYDIVIAVDKYKYQYLYLHICIPTEMKTIEKQKHFYDDTGWDSDADTGGRWFESLIFI